MMERLNLQEVKSVTGMSSEDFKKDYFGPHIPVVLKDFSSEWPAMKKWTPEYFSETYGDNQVKVYNASFGEPGEGYMGQAQATIPFSEYLDKVFNSGSDLRMFLYNIMSHCKELTKDVIKPALVKGFSENFYFMFFGPRGSVTQLHYDIDMSHVFHTVFSGSKKFYLFSQEQNKLLYRHPFTVRSYVDVVTPDLEKFPMLRNAQGYEVTLHKGDTLFIPAGYWHHIVYEDASFALSLRCRHQSILKRLQGFYNLLVMQMVDRLINRLASEKWFKWKSSRAQELASQA